MSKKIFKIKSSYKLDFLIALYIFCIIGAELMGSKSFPLFTVFGYQLNSSVAIFFIPILFTINDIIVEVYGKERIHNLIKTSFFIIFLIIVFASFFTFLPYTDRFAETEAAYDTIFQKSVRISIASLIAFAIAGFLDVYVFVHLKYWLKKHPLWLRNNLSNFVSMFFDTFIFMILAFYGIKQGFSENFTFIFSIAIPYWLLKCFMSVMETPFTYWGIKWLREEK